MENIPKRMRNDGHYYLYSFCKRTKRYGVEPCLFSVSPLYLPQILARSPLALGVSRDDATEEQREGKRRMTRLTDNALSPLLTF